MSTKNLNDDIDSKIYVDEQQSNNLVDIGIVFHEHSTTLMSLVHSLNPVFEYLGPNPFEGKGEPTIEQIEELLTEPVRSLLNSLASLINSIRMDWETRYITEDQWDELTDKYEKLRHYKKRVNRPIFRPHFLRQIARKLTNLFDDLEDSNLNKQAVGNIRNYASNIERLVCLYDLSNAKSRVISMDQQARSLRNYLTASARPKEEPEVVKLQDLVNHAIREMETFSKERRVELRLKSQSPSCLVRCVKNDVRRALYNILNNSIKYSWHMMGEEMAWVTINCYTKYGFVFVAVENWGVPIKEDEIKEGLIFQMGYRGILSSDGGRLGTGIGLYDAWKTAKDNGGEVIVISAPARDSNKTSSYANPYITTVSFKLPILAEIS